MSVLEKIDSEIIFKQLPVSSCIVNGDTLKIVYVNDHAMEMYGYSKDEFKKLHIWELNILESKKDMLSRVKKIKKLKHYSFKTRHIRKDKKIMDVTIFINCITIKDRLFFNVACQNDTHKLKVENKLDYFEKKFEYFFNQLPEPILIIDQTLEKIVNVNKAATDFLGYSEEELSKINFSNLVQINQESKSCKDVIEFNLANKQKTFEQRFTRKDGTDIDALITIKKLNSPYGVNLIITCRDVTLQRHEELQLKELNQTLKRNIEIKANELYKNERILLEQSKYAQMGEMLNMIAHQWRQPLNSIATAALNLSFQNELDNVSKDSIESSSEFIQDETQRMSQIINDFMEFNKPDINRKFLLHQATSEVKKMITPQLVNRSISLEIDIDKKLELFHNIKSIEHVLLNLITNAKDAFAQKSDIEDKKVKIYTTVLDNTIAINVEDNAGGIPENIIEKIFNPYFTTKKMGEGTGIGLYMSKRMIESIEGSSLIVKNSDKGAIFSIVFKY